MCVCVCVCVMYVTVDFQCQGYLHNYLHASIQDGILIQFLFLRNSQIMYCLHLHQYSVSVCLCLFVLVPTGGRLCVRSAAYVEDLVPALLECRGFHEDRPAAVGHNTEDVENTSF